MTGLTTRTWPLWLLLLLAVSWSVVYSAGSLPEAQRVEQGESQPLLAPLSGLTPGEEQRHAAGAEAFVEQHSPERGLGPLFNQTSCAPCHPLPHRSAPEENGTFFGRWNEDGHFDPMYHRGGPFLQGRAVPGYEPEVVPEESTVQSLRGGPRLLGLGLVEAIPDATLIALADPKDEDGDGISGRVAWVEAPEYLEVDPSRLRHNGRFLGRFGLKASTIDLLHQTVTSMHEEVGVTTELEWSFVSDAQGDHLVRRYTTEPEVPKARVDQLVFYLRTLEAPPRSGVEAPEVRQGEALFARTGCTACHVPELHTGEHAVAALRERTVPLYSDLLLHDLGPSLADNFPQGDASGSEWRTAPLWGLGAAERDPAVTPYYLHDGRTSDLTEAILLHGGEAEVSRERFAALPEAERRAVLAFLRSL